MRRGEWAEAARVSGIECVGLVKSCPGGELPVGAKVAALMGGLGRTINGSYAEYTRAPRRTSRSSNPIFLGPSSRRSRRPMRLPGRACSATWKSRRANLGDPGATSSFGQAAVKLAVNGGVKVTATAAGAGATRCWRARRFGRLDKEGPDLSKRIALAKQLDAVLDLVGNSTILDSLAMLRRGGRACLAGWLGGLAPITDFNPLLQMGAAFI